MSGKRELQLSLLKYFYTNLFYLFDDLGKNTVSKTLNSGIITFLGILIHFSIKNWLKVLSYK